jgi:hypothetical protein
VTKEVSEARRAGLSAAARTLTRRALGRRGGASVPAELRFRLPRRLRALRGATRGAQRNEPVTGSLRCRDGSLAGVLVLFAIAEVGEWHLPFTRKPGRGRAGGRTASSKRATATSEGTPGDGSRRQSRGTGTEPEKGFSTMEGISGRTSHGSFTETWWTRPRPSVRGSTGVSPKAVAGGTRQGCQSRAGGSVAGSSRELTGARPGAASRQRSRRRNDGRRSGPGEVKRTVRRPREQSRTKRHCRVERVLVFETWVAYVGLMYLGRTSAGRLTVLGDAGLALRSSAGP